MSVHWGKNEGELIVRIACDADVLRIFHMTDLHYHDFLPQKMAELEAFRELIAGLGADMVVNTGDFFCRSDPHMVLTVATWFDRIMGSVGPWCLALGNHDHEWEHAEPEARLLAIESALASLPRSLFCRSHERLRDEPGPSFAEEVGALARNTTYPIPKKGDAPLWDGFLGGNYLLRIERSQKLAWEVFILNSRNYLHVPRKARSWMARVHTPGCPAVVFFHVPPQAYHTIMSRGSYVGQAAERVCFEGEDGSFHAFLRQELPDVVACFAGHDHVNDYCGVLDSVLYGYGRKSGVVGYGGYVSTPKEKDIARGKIIRMGGTLVSLDLGGMPPQSTLETREGTRIYGGIRLDVAEMPPELYRRHGATG